ncbi:MAG: polyprenyl synthetase family protein [Deltaproteobacteria bacterium]|nr:polyprenyl synthetase family protein [Deltaproteobacteria bacterium]
MDITAYLSERKAIVDRSLAAYLERREGCPPRLIEAMRYSLMAGGKRLRPILTMAAAAAVGGKEVDVLPCACALEMIHTFSLIHDDLPAMDDDDLRRGVPTNHKVFGEGLAILAGDGLLAEAFGATGAGGMVGGQVLDMEGEGRQMTQIDVTQTYRLKTGALIKVAVTSGAKLVGATTAQLAALERYGAAAGLAFQIADDLLGMEGEEAQLGKRVGNDAARGKATYPVVVGAAAARTRMRELTAEALTAITSFGDPAEPLRATANYITERKS